MRECLTKSIITIVLATCALNTKGQNRYVDTVKSLHAFSDPANYTVVSDSIYGTVLHTLVIENKFLAVDTVPSLGRIIEEIEEGRVHTLKNDTNLVSCRYTIKNCTYCKCHDGNDGESTQDRTLRIFKLENSVEVSGIDFPELIIDRCFFEKSLHLFQCTSKLINLYGCIGKIFISNSIGVSKIFVRESRDVQLICKDNHCNTKSDIDVVVHSSLINLFECDGHRAKVVNYRFSNDTLQGDFMIGGKMGIDTYQSDSCVVIFEDCKINTSLKISQFAKSQIVKFINCTFGPLASNIDITAGKVTLEHCALFSKDNKFLLRPTETTVELWPVNTSIDNGTIAFDGKLKLMFRDEVPYDIVMSTYEKLMECYQREHSSHAAEIVDRDYRATKAYRGSYRDKFCYWVTWTWWDFGYTKGQVFIWIAGILAIFVVVNLRNWESIKQVYPPNESGIIEKADSKNNTLRHCSVVFLYTLFIFFSLRIDLDKLKFGSILIVVLLLFEYVVGLICLLFITKYVISI